jgi:cell division protein FtsQ
MFGRQKRIRRNTYKGRRRNRRRAIWTRTLATVKMVLAATVFALFNLMLIFGHDWITQTERLRIRSVTVEGCARLTPAMVKAQAGLTEEGNILGVNLATTRKRLLAHPWIAQARVTRDIPDRLQIHIQEHSCLAVLDLGRRFLMNAEGQVFKELKPGETQDVPLVSGLTYVDLGLHADAPTAVMRAVMDILQPRRRSRRHELAGRLREIHADPVLGLTLFQADSNQPLGYRTVMLGFDDFDEKLARLQKIDAYLQNHRRYAGFRSIDLNNPHRIIVNPVETRAAQDPRKEV